MIKVGILFALVSAAVAASSWVEVLKSEEVDVNKRSSSMKNLFRLFDASELGSNFTGNLLLMSNIRSQFGYVFGNFSNDVGQMVCQEMGYKRMKGTPYRNDAIPAGFSAHAEGIECGVGSSGSLIDFDSSCKVYRATREKTGDAVFLDCEERLEEAGYPELLFVNSDREEPKASSGVLIVKWTYNGEMRAATVSHYGDTIISFDAADLICRKMGYSGVRDLGADKLPVILENLDTLMRIDVNCLGNETDIFDCPLKPSNSTNDWAVLHLTCEEERDAADRVQPDAFHLLPFPDSTLNGGLVLAGFNETLSTICLSEQSDYDQFCSDDGSSGTAVPAEWYFNRTDLEQFPTLSQGGNYSYGNTEFYRNSDDSCNEGNRLAVFCTRRKETVYYVDVYNPNNGEVNSNEGIVIVLDATDGRYEPDAMKHGMVHFSGASSADQETICNTLGFPGVARAGRVADENENYRKFNEAFHKHVADYAVERLGCPAGASNIAECNLNLVGVDEGNILDSLVIKCDAIPEPTPEPTPEPVYYVGVYNPDTAERNSNEGIVFVSAVTDRNFYEDEVMHGLVYFSGASSADQEMICNTLGFPGVARAGRVADENENYRKSNEAFHNDSDYAVERLGCPAGASYIVECNLNLVGLDEGNILDTLVIKCNGGDNRTGTSPTPVPITTTPGPTSEPGPFPTSDNEVDLDFGGMNLTLHIGRHRYRERF